MDFDLTTRQHTILIGLSIPEGYTIHIYSKQEVEQALNIAWESLDKWWLIDTFDHISPNKWNYETDFSCL